MRDHDRPIPPRALRPVRWALVVLVLTAAAAELTYMVSVGVLFIDVILIGVALAAARLHRRPPVRSRVLRGPVVFALIYLVVGVPALWHTVHGSSDWPTPRGLAGDLFKALLAAVILLAAAVAVACHHARRAAVRADPAAEPCPGCGHDLRAADGRCPECGRVTAVPSRRQLAADLAALAAGNPAGPPGGADDRGSDDGPHPAL